MSDEPAGAEPVMQETGPTDDEFGPTDAAEEARFVAWKEGDPDRRVMSDRRAEPRGGGRRSTDRPAVDDPMTTPQTVPCPTCATPMVWTRAEGLKGQVCSNCDRVFTGRERRPRPAESTPDQVESAPVALGPMDTAPPPVPEPEPEQAVWNDFAEQGPPQRGAVTLVDVEPRDPGPFVMPPHKASLDLPGALVSLWRRTTGAWGLITYAGVVCLVVIFVATVATHSVNSDRRDWEVRRLNLETTTAEAQEQANVAAQATADSLLQVERDRLALERERLDAENAARAAAEPLPTVTAATTSTTAVRR